MNDLQALANKNIKDVCTHALQHGPNDGALVIFDTQADLARIITDAFRSALPNADYVDFDTRTPAEILALIDARKPGDLVVLVQSTNFRLDEFRLRIELFKRNLKTIEMVHLLRMSEDQYETYINALAYDPNYYRPLGRALKEKIDSAQKVVVHCGDVELVYDGGMEEAKLNLGDYTGMTNIGGTFPIGEVFTEAKDFSKVNGSVKIFAFAGMDHCLRLFKPFTVHIKESMIVGSEDAPQEFHDILELVGQDEPVMIREFGMSLNPAMGKEHIVNDVTAFERMLGLHVSLGAKHGVYSKPGIQRKKARYHIDVFIDMDTIIVDEKPIYAQGKYIV